MTTLLKVDIEENSLSATMSGTPMQLTMLLANFSEIEDKLTDALNNALKDSHISEDMLKHFKSLPKELLQIPHRMKKSMQELDSKFDNATPDEKLQLLKDMQGLLDKIVRGQ